MKVLLLFFDTAGEPSNNSRTAALSAEDNFARIPFRASTTEVTELGELAGEFLSFVPSSAAAVVPTSSP
jgi:hypothetical protein